MSPKTPAVILKMNLGRVAPRRLWAKGVRAGLQVICKNSPLGRVRDVLNVPLLAQPWVFPINDYRFNHALDVIEGNIIRIFENDVQVRAPVKRTDLFERREVKSTVPTEQASRDAIAKVFACRDDVGVVQPNTVLPESTGADDNFVKGGRQINVGRLLVQPIE